MIWPSILGDHPTPWTEWEHARTRYSKPSDMKNLIESAENVIAELADLAASHYDDLCTCDDALTCAQDAIRKQQENLDQVRIKYARDIKLLQDINNLTEDRRLVLSELVDSLLDRVKGEYDG